MPSSSASVFWGQSTAELAVWMSVPLDRYLPLFPFLKIRLEKAASPMRRLEVVGTKESGLMSQLLIDIICNIKCPAFGNLKA